jgi:hypothetical protein
VHIPRWSRVLLALCFSLEPYLHWFFVKRVDSGAIFV